MLKYLSTDIVCQEVPDEISLAIAITGCTIRCPGCHSRFLWEDKGEILDVETLCGLLNNNQGITCCLFMGGEHDIDTLTELLMYAHKRVKTAWYCGLDMIPKDKIGILEHLDFCKLGHYDQDLGGLDSPTTNQRLYQYSKYFSECTIAQGWRDITNLLTKKI
jgi:anaerobic ribonucleoside-triphosphate reductase activating protein